MPCYHPKVKTLGFPRVIRIRYRLPHPYNRHVQEWGRNSINGSVPPPSPSVAVAVADDAAVLGLLLPAVVLRVSVDAEAGRGELAGTTHLSELLRGDCPDVDSGIALVLAQRVSRFPMSGGFQFSPPSVMFGNILYDSDFIYTTR